jgi:hypothetical protein
MTNIKDGVDTGLKGRYAAGTCSMHAPPGLAPRAHDGAAALQLDPGGPGFIPDQGLEAGRLILPEAKAKACPERSRTSRWGFAQSLFGIRSSLRSSSRERGSPLRGPEMTSYPYPGLAPGANTRVAALRLAMGPAIVPVPPTFPNSREMWATQPQHSERQHTSEWPAGGPQFAFRWQLLDRRSRL